MTKSRDLLVNDRIYIIYSIKGLNDDSLTLIQSKTYTGDSKSFLTAFEVVLVNTFYQFQNNVYFYAEDDETKNINLILAL